MFDSEIESRVKIAEDHVQKTLSFMIESLVFLHPQINSILKWNLLIGKKTQVLSEIAEIEKIDEMCVLVVPYELSLCKQITSAIQKQYAFERGLLVQLVEKGVKITWPAVTSARRQLAKEKLSQILHKAVEMLRYKRMCIKKEVVDIEIRKDFKRRLQTQLDERTKKAEAKIIHVYNHFNKMI